MRCSGHAVLAAHAEVQLHGTTHWLSAQCSGLNHAGETLDGCPPSEKPGLARGACTSRALARTLDPRAVAHGRHECL